MKLRRLTRLQLLMHVSAWIPLAVLVFQFLTGNLTANPIQAAEKRTGDTAIFLLILSLACTPVNSIFRVPQVLRLRRPLGLYAYLYAAIHLSIFLGLDYGLDFGLILQTIVEKPFVIAGLSTFIILSALAATSFRWSKVNLGKNWKRLHRLVYFANLLVVLHFAWSIKGDFFRLHGDVFRPLLAGIAVLLLLGLRVKPVRVALAGIFRRGSPPTGSSQRRGQVTKEGTFPQ
jgi:sulfoxide reductase heme-binding subunit YedZ